MADPIEQLNIYALLITTLCLKDIDQDIRAADSLTLP